MKGDGTLALFPADGGSNVQFGGQVQVRREHRERGPAAHRGHGEKSSDFFDKLAEERAAVEHAA